MNRFLRCASLGSFLAFTSLWNTAPAQDKPEGDNNEGVEVQVKGPVHEAFAQPVDSKPVQSAPVPKEPPPPIPEEPPEERPDGANVQFISGYWAWSPESSRFLWVSGTYRNVPVGRQWVAGHWTNTNQGWHWISGFWAPADQQDLQYTPEPPEPLQVDPSMPPPDDQSRWVPGTWVYRESRFVWRPGYWAPFRIGSVWNSPCYYWTPNGYLFNDGYWDYPLEDRGLLFAPVYFNRPFWNNAGWFYRPSYVVNFGMFYDSCFRRSGSFGFFFGNYYGGSYLGFGYSPWFNGYGRYDPLFAYRGWRGGFGPNRNWHAGQQQLYAARAAGRAPTPPGTFAQQNALAFNKASPNNPQRVVAPLKQAKTLNNNVNLVKLTPAQVQSQKAVMQKAQTTAQNRAKVGNISATAPKTLGPQVQKSTPKTNFPGANTGKFNPNVNGKGSTPKTVQNPNFPNVNGKGSTPKTVQTPNVPKTTTGAAPNTKGRSNPTAPNAVNTPKGKPSVPMTRFDPSTTAPKGGGAGQAPRNVVPPRVTSPSPSTPKGVAPSAPRVGTPPRTTAPPTATPRTFSPPPSAPRNISPAPSAPRNISPAPSAPRSFSPAPSAPRNFSPAPRSSPPRSAPAPRPSGGNRGRG